MKSVKEMFVWSVFEELFQVLCGTFYNLFNEQLRDKLKFVFNPDVILCGWLGSKHHQTN